MRISMLFRKTGLICSVFLFVLTASPVFAQDFTINKFHSDITINEDSSFIVIEKIDIEFHRSKHGIYREIPYRYINELGKTHITPLDVLSVTDAAEKKWKYKVTKAGNVVNIRIGDAKKYVTGRQTYVITYKVENATIFLDDHDELYWNVTGNYWKAAIKEASSNVMLAAKDKSKELWAACYTGGMGSREKQCGFQTSNNNGEFFTKKNLRTGEGFTVAFGWDKGLVSPPSSWKKFLWAVNLRENWVFIFPIFSLLFMVNLWRTRGRDPKVRESVTVMYEPPKHNNIPLPPAEVGSIVDEKMDARDITSSIVGLAVRGYIKIEETKKERLIFDKTDYYLSRTKEPDNTLSAFEQALMSKLFTDRVHPGILVSEMKNSFYKYLDSLKTTLNGELVSKKYFLKSPDKVKNVYFVAGIMLAFSGPFLAVLLLPEFLKIKGIVALALSGLPVIAFAKAMPAKTKLGASVYMDILGFQEFLNRAEKDRIERMGDKDLFSKFLPYAIALDVADNWAKAFEGIYQDPPQWYVSPAGFTTFSPYSFSHSISSMTSDLGSAMFSAPRSSGAGGGGGGFSGGGSSGGGFGGGGGGSW
jgi:uncharacterized membrane protein